MPTLTAQINDKLFSQPNVPHNLTHELCVKVVQGMAYENGFKPGIAIKWKLTGARDRVIHHGDIKEK